jgi:hypothetical protein
LKFMFLTESAGGFANQPLYADNNLPASVERSLNPVK